MALLRCKVSLDPGDLCVNDRIQQLADWTHTLIFPCCARAINPQRDSPLSYERKKQSTFGEPRKRHAPGPAARQGACRNYCSGRKPGGGSKEPARPYEKPLR